MKIRQLPDGRYVELHADGRLEYCAADGGLIQPLNRDDGLYAGLGLSVQKCIVQVRGPDLEANPPVATWTVYQSDGTIKTAKRDAALYNAMDPSTHDDPYVVVWVGPPVMAYGTREDSNEIKYGSRNPTAEQIDHGGANVLPPVAGEVEPE